MRSREFEVRTGGGRRLIAVEEGPADGELVLLHHGSPGSHRMFSRHIEEGAERGLRHVSYARPGYAGSDHRRGRSYADSVPDSVAVVDALGVDSFYSLGLSGGGGPALACAALIPDRVRSAVSASALGPRSGLGSDWLENAARSNVEEFQLLDDGELEVLAARIEQEIAEWSGFETVYDLTSGMDELLCEADLNLSAEYRSYQLTGCRMFGPEDLWGWFDDDWAMWSEWGFDLAAITVPVTIWQGGQDRFVPPQNGKWLAANVPGAKLRFFEDEGHMSLFDRHYGAMLDDLIASAQPG
jgi:pimeloyl-ACP methyl ester carboxylesterase